MSGLAEPANGVTVEASGGRSDGARWSRDDADELDVYPGEPSRWVDEPDHAMRWTWSAVLLEAERGGGVLRVVEPYTQ